MDIQPSIPPYGQFMTQQVIQCTAEAAVRYQVPELLLHAIVAKERGTPGKCSAANSNGSKDCGLAQINNSVWGDKFLKYGITMDHIKNDSCINMNISAYVLKTYHNEKKDWFKAIISYNIGPNKWTPNRYSIGYKYANDVVKYWWQFQNWAYPVPTSTPAP